MKPVLAALIGLALLSACAKRPENITPRFASAAGYRAMQCDQLNDERMRVGMELQRVTDLQRENADADAALMGVGMILFWPALIGLAATTDRSEQLSQMMGERDAMELAARERSCAAVALPSAPVPAAPIPPATPVGT